MSKLTKQQVQALSRPKTLTLYHYTNERNLPSIYAFGLYRGEVPVSTGGGFDAVWLTTDPEAKNQGWRAGVPFDKTQIRITLEMDRSKEELWKWSDLAKALQMNKDWYQNLTFEGGNNGGEAWYVHLGIIPVQSFKKVEKKTISGWEEIKIPPVPDKPVCRGPVYPPGLSLARNFLAGTEPVTLTYHDPNWVYEYGKIWEQLVEQGKLRPVKL